jgi:glycosyltransferase involved in cell wall biosynthesis
MNRYANELSTAISALDQDRWSFEIVQPDQRRWISRAWNHRQCVRLENAVTRYAVYPLAICRQAADLFHVLDHGYGHLVRAIDPSRTIVTCHDLVPLLSADRRIPIAVPASVVRTFRFRIKSMARASRIIADSKATRDSLLEYTDIPAARITVIPLGVSRFFKPCEPCKVLGIRQRLGLNSQAKVILQVATRGRYKNTPGVLRAFAEVRRRLGPSVILARVGVPLHEDEASLADRLGVTDAIRFIGAVADDSALAYCYQAANVLAFPSFWEGFGWPPLEAMACGTPVVASNIPAIREVVKHGADLVDPNDDAALAAALSRVITDETHAAQLRAEGLERARELTWDVTARRTLDVYDEVAGNSTAAGRERRPESNVPDLQGGTAPATP